ncbi:PDR/VanB family oxidoreductase [Streptomyces sp. NPDC001537]
MTSTIGPLGQFKAPEPIEVTVLRRQTLAEGVVAFDLAATSGKPLPPWAPGAHIDLDIPEIGVSRQYSLCGAVGDHTWRIAVLRDPQSRGGSAWLHDHAHENTKLRISGFRNHFVFTADGPVIFVAGGIGITSLVPMIAEAESCGLPWELHYAGRSTTTMAYLADLRKHGERVHIYTSDSTRLDVQKLLRECREGTTAYACGPERLLTALTDAAATRPMTLRTERFSGADIDTAGDAAFEITCARSGVRIEVPADRSILAALQDHGIRHMSQCEEGVCGSCETAVLEGVPEHRDVLLTDEERAENSVMMICVSRAKTTHLTLDL